LEKGNRVQDPEVRMLSSKVLVLHQVQQIIIPGRQVIAAHAESKVEIPFVVGISWKRARGGNIVRFMSNLADAVEKLLDSLIRESPVLGPDLGPVQDILDLGKDGIAHMERKVAALDEFEEKPRRRASRPGCRLEEYHAVENDTWGAVLAHVGLFD
jgi:hypothetical protein